MKRIVVCADDYALAPGVSEAIRDLIGRGRINATSVMTVVPGFEQAARALLATSAPLAAQIGLHVTLTAPLAPLECGPFPESRTFPPLSALLHPIARFRVHRDAIEREVAAQLTAFTRAFGRPPDFVDGHQHVQLLPAVRDGFLNVVARDAPQAWVRQCGPGGWRPPASGKALYLAWKSIAFRRRAKVRGLQFNAGFDGAYDFSGDYAARFTEFLSRVPDGGVIMCHPGRVDADLQARDSLTDQREREYEFFASPGFVEVLTKAEASLA